MRHPRPVFGTPQEAAAELTYATYARALPKFPPAPTAAPSRPVRWRVALRRRTGPVIEVTARLAFDAWRAAAPALGFPTFAEVWCWLVE